jgi:hypothetical protein
MTKVEEYKFTQENLINLMKSNLNKNGIQTEGVAEISFIETKDKMGFTEYDVKIRRN